MLFSRDLSYLAVDVQCFSGASKLSVELDDSLVCRLGDEVDFLDVALLCLFRTAALSSSAGLSPSRNAAVSDDLDLMRTGVDLRHEQNIRSPRWPVELERRLSLLSLEAGAVIGLNRADGRRPKLRRRMLDEEKEEVRTTG